MILLENLCNRSPGLRSLVIREETPSPLSVGFPAYGLSELTRQHSVAVVPCYGLVLLLPSAGGPALSDSPFRLGIPYQACVDNPLTEVHPPVDPCPDLLGPAETQMFCKKNVGKDKGALGVITSAENPPPFRGQYGREAAPYCARGHGLPDSRLRG